MFPAGPEQQPLDQSDPRRTSTASSRSQCSPANSKLRIREFPAGPPPQAPDQSGRTMQARIENVSIDATKMPDRMSE